MYGTWWQHSNAAMLVNLIKFTLCVHNDTIPPGYWYSPQPQMLFQYPPVQKHLPFVVANSNVVTLWGDIQCSDVAERCRVSWPVREDRQRWNMNLHDRSTKIRNSIQVSGTEQASPFSQMTKDDMHATLQLWASYPLALRTRPLSSAELGGLKLAPSPGHSQLFNAICTTNKLCRHQKAHQLQSIFLPL